MPEKRETISHDSKIANSFSDFFDSLKMLYIHLVSKQTNILMTIRLLLKKFEQHSSLNLINKNISNNKRFHFLPAEHESILREIINLNNKKKWNF